MDGEELFDITGDSLQTIASYAVLFLTLNAPSHAKSPWGIMSSGARHLALTCSRTSRRQAPKAINAISAAITAIDQATFNDAKFVGSAIERTTPTPGAVELRLMQQLSNGCQKRTLIMIDMVRH